MLMAHQIFTTPARTYELSSLAEAAFVPMASFAHLSPVISIGSLSKRLASRMGSHVRSLWDSDARKGFKHLRLIPELQAAVPAILSDAREEFHRNVLTELESSVDAIYTGIDQIQVLHCHNRPQGSMFMMVEVDTSLLLGIENDVDFARELMREESVLVLPAGFVLLIY